MLKRMERHLIVCHTLRTFFSSRTGEAHNQRVDILLPALVRIVATGSESGIRIGILRNCCGYQSEAGV